MTNANTFKSMVGVLIGFAVLYFIVLGITSLSRAVKNKKRKKQEEKEEND